MWHRARSKTFQSRSYRLTSCVISSLSARPDIASISCQYREQVYEISPTGPKHPCELLDLMLLHFGS